MPSQIVTANVANQVVAAAVRNGVYKPTSITIDNTLGAADRIINVRDTFTPSISNAVPVPVAQNINRLQVTCFMGEILNLGEPDLAGVKCLGSLGIIADAVDAACFVSVGYKTE